MDSGTFGPPTGEDTLDPFVCLRKAVIAGDEDLVRGLLTQHKGLASANDAGRTALQLAIEHGQPFLVQTLLDHGADLEAADALGRTPLHQAVERNNVPLTMLLLRCGANVEATTPDGVKPLWVAASKGSEPVAKLLLQCKADVESLNTKSATTALFEAVNQGHVALIKLLLDNGADINGQRLNSPVQAGRGPEKPPGTQMSRPRFRSGYPMGWSQGAERRNLGTRRSHRGHNSMLSYLTGRSREDEENSESMSDDAGEEPGGPVSVWATPGPPGWSHTSAHARPPPRPHPAHPVPPAPWGHGGTGQPKSDLEIPLHKAVLNGNIEVVRLLLQHGASISIRGKDGRSAQQVAEEQDARELVTLLHSGFLLQGPAIQQENSKQGGPQFVILPAPRGNSEKMACRVFEATMVEFYIEDREQRHQASAPIFNVLYGDGPESILASGRPKSVSGKRPSFTWYHLPANNV